MKRTVKLAIDICRRLSYARRWRSNWRPRAWVRSDCGAVRDKLDARFKLLTGGSRATPRRHQTLARRVGVEPWAAERR